ncbi:hypothetical protein BOX15_Mlig012200g2 [Macrostomum lignano]|uniref:Uncharacterized protein n=1 Tax=Macrostomum lignano TaxID=282301 RepID=A0A267GC74_9PLAT|nr:hypothetical protein BOX15_Mlig012200g2 [Macrostomum lignano]
MLSFSLKSEFTCLLLLSALTNLTWSFPGAANEARLGPKTDNKPIVGLTLHILDLNEDQPEGTRMKRVIDLTEPATYHCGKCPTCLCYYRRWR